MNGFTDFSALTHAAWVLPFWGIAIKSTIAVALAAVACALLGRRSAAVRHRVWVFGLAASLVLAPACLLTPRLALRVPVSVLEVGGWMTSDREPSAVTGRVGAPRFGSNSRNSVAGVVPRPERGARRNDEVSENDAASGGDKVADRSAPTLLVDVERLLFAGWLIGAVIGSSLLLISLARQSTRLHRLRRIEDDDWREAVAAAARTLGLRRPVVTLESDQACVPAVVGVFRPRLLVPPDWRAWSPAQRRCILLHELAHVKRFDVATQLLGRLALLVYWFNPLVWHAVRRLRVEREIACDDCVLSTGQRASDYAEQLLWTLKRYRPAGAALVVAMAHTARLDQRVRAILDPRRRREPVGYRFAVLLPLVVAVMCGVLGGITLSRKTAFADPSEQPGSETVAQEPAPEPLWTEIHTIEYPGSLPVSAAFSADGQLLVTGDTNGEVMALVFPGDEPQWRWKTRVEGSHPAVAMSADQKKVYATAKHGARILDAATGQKEELVEARDSHPIAIGVFPDRKIVENVERTQIVFGNPRGYFVKSWVRGKLEETTGTIETSTVANDAKPDDEAAVPLAVDPKGRSAIMTGPVDATGNVSGVKGKNVLWAYVCGDYEAGSPGNRVMVGHTAAVVSAAWSKGGETAVTGDASGRVIVWDAKTMKETGRRELGGRVAALAISDDGNRAAAYVIGKAGEVFVWDVADPKSEMNRIHAELSDFGGAALYADLSFSPDGRRLAGCAINKLWLSRAGELVGKVRLWKLVDPPRDQPSPKPVYMKSLPKGGSSDFVVLDNHSVLMPASKQGAVDFRALADGGILMRLVLGEFRIGRMRLSADRKWLALERHAPVDARGESPEDATFEVGVYESVMTLKATIPDCRRLIDIASGGTTVAVVREGRVEIWDVATTKLLKSAPFDHDRIDAAAFSPDGRLLAISDVGELLLWNWELDRHERIDLGRTVVSLAFSPDGRFLAEGPKPGEDIRIRDVSTRKIVRVLKGDASSSMAVAAMDYAQGGRILISGDDGAQAENIAAAPRIKLWDTSTGAVAHRIAPSAGLPQNLGVSPNGLYLVATLDDGESGVKLGAWRLDGKTPARESAPAPPAADVSDRSR